MMDAAETPRERRVIYIGLLTGARVGELAALQIRHLERPGWVWFSEDIAKGHTERWVPVLPELAPIIAEVVENVPALAFVIPTRLQKPGHRLEHEPISRTRVNRIVKDVARRAGIAANIHPHLLRHSFGDHIAQYAGLRAAQALMGHASVETTARVYTSRPGLDELAEACGVSDTGPTREAMSDGTSNDRQRHRAPARTGASIARCGSRRTASAGTSRSAR